jgi:signal transduction histidine kinase
MMAALAVCAWLMLALYGGPIAAAEPKAGGTLKRVLILQSFGSDFAPYNVLSSSFRSELAQALGEPVEFHEVSVQGTNASDPALEDALVGYLIATGAQRRPDLVVAIGGQAGRFALSRRDVFPATPVLFAGVDQRFVRPDALTNYDAAVPVANDVPAVVENILQVLPQTGTVAVVLGSSPLERFWRAELGRELEPFESRVRLIWWDELSGHEMLARAADLPPRSAILYVLFHVDAAGVPHASPAILAGLHETANAPIFGLFDAQLGQGIVGGPLVPIGTVSRLSVDAATRILRGEPPASCRVPAVKLGPPTYDWRELERWDIPARDLPPGSTVRFRPPSAWEHYRWPILGGLSIIALLIGLVIGLLIQRAHRRVAQREVRALSQRLLTAFEDERRWLARELHDDLAQRLARLAIDAARLERDGSGPTRGVDLAAMRGEIISMSSDVHALSRRLHPSLLDNLGLAEALRAEVERFSEAESIAVDLQLEELADKPSPDAALCLYRVAQESLRNVARHARAKKAEISLRTRDGGVELEVRDNGVGFDPDAHRGAHSLGHASMRERIHLVRGRLAIRSAPGRGTSVAAWVPAGGGGS